MRQLERKKTEEGKLKMKKREAVLNIQKWDKKVQLAKQKQAQEGGVASTTPFNNRMAESRTLKR